MSGLDFISYLEPLGIVDDEVLRKLRSKLSRPGKPVPASRVAKFLIEKGELTKPQAERQLERFKDSSQLKPVDMLSEADVVEDEGGIVDLAGADPLTGVDPVGGLQQLGPEDVLADGADALAPGDAVEDERARRVFEAKRQLANRWESKWMIIGPTVVVILAVTAGFLWFVLTRRSADKMLDIAEGSYRSSSYSQAIEDYQEFLDAYPRNPSASLARVRQGIARIRTFSDVRSWDKALGVLPEVLPVIQDEEAFPVEGRPELTSILPRIAMGFVEQAERAEDVETKEQLVTKTEDAMTFVNDSMYMPTSARRQVSSTLTELADRLKSVRDDIDRERRLVADIEQIDKAIADNQTSKAFGIRKSLLRDFPVLESDPRLAEAAERTADHEQGLVRTDVPRLPVSTDWPETNIDASVVLATRVGQAVPDLTGQICPLLIRGAVYMIDVSNGSVLWRQPVGQNTSLQPVWVNERGGDLIIANQQTHDVARVEGRTGELVWRTRIGEPFGNLTLTKDSVFVATRSGRLIQLALEPGTNGETEGGEAVDGVVIPQPLIVGPATDRTGRYLYQPGLQGNIYVLERGEDDSPMACREVYYLGHRDGSITVPPILSQGFLFVIENSGTDYALLHVLKPTQRGLELEPAQTPIRLRGEVLAAVELYGRRGLLTLTDLGAINLYEVDLVAEEEPLRRVAQFSRSTQAGTYSFYLAEKGNLWVGDEGVTAFEVQAQRGQFRRINTYEGNDDVIAPFALYGDTLIETRIRAGSRLVSVYAVTADGHDEIWRTDFAAPLAGPPLVELDGQMLAVTSQGDQYVIDQGVLDAGVAVVPRQRASTTEQDLIFDHTVDFGQGKVICFGPPQVKRLLGIDPAQVSVKTNLANSPVPDGTLAFAPVAFGNDVLAGSTQGPVFLLDSFRGSVIGTPFQPAIGPSKVIEWVSPAVVDESRFVIGDGEGNLYAVQRGSNGLTKQAEVRVAGPLISGLVAVEGTVFGIVQVDGVPVLQRFQASDLASQGELELPAAVAFGPRVVGDQVLLGTTDSQLHAINTSGEVRWSIDLGSTRPVGVTPWKANLCLVVLANGEIAVVDVSSGEFLGSLTLGQPLTGDATIHNGQVYVQAVDGTLLVAGLPAL